MVNGIKVVGRAILEQESEMILVGSKGLTRVAEMERGSERIRASAEGRGEIEMKQEQNGWLVKGKPLDKSALGLWNQSNKKPTTLSYSCCRTAAHLLAIISRYMKTQTTDKLTQTQVFLTSFYSFWIFFYNADLNAT